MVSGKQGDCEALLKQAGTTYPKVLNLSSRIRDKINSILKRTAYQAIPDYDPGTSVIQANSSYTVTVNLDGILSIKFEDYYYPEMAAHGVTGAGSVTLDLRTAHVYQFKELFRRDSNYRVEIERIIEEQIAANRIPVLKPFEGVGDNAYYYLTPDTLVIYYQPYEYTPAYYGVLEFKIPYTEIIDIVDPRGPIGCILNMS